MNKFNELVQRVKKETGWNFIELLVEGNRQYIKISKYIDEGTISLHLYPEKRITSEEELIFFIKQATKNTTL